MAAQVVDGYNRPPSAAIAKAGYAGALCYLYNVTPAEIAAHHAAGLCVGLIAEYDTSTYHPVLAGAPAGKVNGADALGKTRALGAPAKSGIALWCTADTDVAPSQFSTVGAYLDAFSGQTPGYATGIYGGADLVDWCIVNGHASHGWVAAAASWSHGHVSAHACLEQLVGGQKLPGTDVDNILQDDWGQWTPQGGPDMPLTPADIQAIWDGMPQSAIDKIAGRVPAFMANPSENPAGCNSNTAAQVASLAKAGGSGSAPTKFTGTVEIEAS